MTKDIEAAAYLKDKIKYTPKIGIVLGTGLGDLAECVEDAVVIPYTEVPHFPVSTAPGHKGRFVSGRLAGAPVLIMQGRIHFYEGYTMQELAFPIQVMKAAGIEELILTNASGGINAAYTPGDLVCIKDHIKFDLDSPQRGRNREDLGGRFFDMTHAYAPSMRKIAKETMAALGLPEFEGVYAYMGGPQFETPAEIRMLRILGADLVGMSTVPEAITAAHCGIRCMGISCVTNMAAGMENGGLDPAVIHQAEADARQNFENLVKGIVERLWKK